MPRTAILEATSTSTVSVRMDGQIRSRIRLNFPTSLRSICDRRSRSRIGVASWIDKL